jgi:DNA-damage-inducible protein D
MANVSAQTGLRSLLAGGNVRRYEVGGQPLFAAVDVIAALADAQAPAEHWADLKQREPRLAELVERAHSESGEARPEDVELIPLEAVLRLVQSIASPKAERIKLWLARSARQRLEEAENPELAMIRTRKLYESKGYSPRWVDKRLRGVSARHELTSEWFKRGATESEQYRALTNELTSGTFGTDVEGLRRFKGLHPTRENLRDHMSDIELALTALAETVAVNLHRTRDSHELKQLAADVRDAGEIVAETRQLIEARTGNPVVTPGNYRSWWASRRHQRTKRHGRSVA